MADSHPWVLSVFDHLPARSDIKHMHRFCVWRVPLHIRRVKPSRYDCTVLPLGLYNRDFRNVTSTDQLKLEVLSVFLRHMNLLDSRGWYTFCAEISTPPPDATPLEDFFHDPPIESFITPEVIRSVLVIDAVFITSLLYVVNFFQDEGEALDFFRVGDEDAFRTELSNVFSRTGFQVYSFLDHLLLFENQIPLFLINNVLRKCIQDSADAECILRSIVNSFVEFFALPCSEAIYPSQLITFHSCDHLLACLHKMMCLNKDSSESRNTGIFVRKLRSACSIALRPAVTMVKHFIHMFAKEGNTGLGRRRTLPTLTQLQKAGIHVRGCTMSICDIHFAKSFLNLSATLYLPKVIFSGKTERIFMNFCMYEFMSEANRPICAYLHVMDDLINTEDDVQLLRKGDEPVIVQNLLGSDKLLAEALFNRPLNGFVTDASDYIHLLQALDDIETWYGARWRHQLTNFIERFITAPWILVTMITAALLLVATVLQTIYTLLEFYRT